MIINDTHKFCFFAIPRTASKAVSHVLVNELDSRQSLRMHASYEEFAQVASPDELSYFKFTTIRNPMDSVVSAYFKKKHDHNGRFSRGTFGKGQPISPKALEQYRFIAETDSPFSEFFKHFYTQPYRRPRLEKTAENCDFVMKFENLEADFQKVLEKLNLPHTPIPVINKTDGKKDDYLQYYTDDVIPLAKDIFGDLMTEWGYEFPKSWS